MAIVHELAFTTALLVASLGVGVPIASAAAPGPPAGAAAADAPAPDSQPDGRAESSGAGSSEPSGASLPGDATELPAPRDTSATGDLPAPRDASATGNLPAPRDASATGDLPAPPDAAATADPSRPRGLPGPVGPELEGPPVPSDLGQRVPGRNGRCGSLPHPRCSLFWLPIASVFVPGLGQAIDRRPSVPYFVAGGLGYGGGLYYTSVYSRAHQDDQGVSFTPTNDMLLDPDGQASLVFGALEQDTGFLSAYDTYRHRLQDDLGVPTAHSSVSDILFAPLHLEKLARPSVLLPLAAVATLTVFSVRQEVDDAYARGTHLTPFHGYRAADAVTTVGLSYGAGTAEEAFFRGFLMSYFEHRWDWNPVLANGLQGAIFSAAHGFGDGVAGFGLRAALGWYLGWLAQRGDYDLTDGVFVHAWWDVIAFSAVYAIERPKLAAGSGRVMMTFPAIAF